MFINGDHNYIAIALADLCSKIGSGATPSGGKAAYCDHGISLIRSTNVFDYNFSYFDLAHINGAQANALANVIVQPNDVLFNITGVSIARCCIVPDDVLPARVNQHVMILRPKQGKDMSYYLLATLCYSENKAKLLGIGQSGSTREAINKQEMESFKIPVPSDNELHRFGVVADTLYKNLTRNIAETKKLEEMQGLLLAQLSSR